MAPVERVLIVGGSPEGAAPGLVARAAASCGAVVAVDRGLDAVLADGVRVDLFCGDADTVGPDGAALVAAVERGDSAAFEVKRFNPRKDDTDLSLALDAVRERWGAPRIVCTRLSGGRPDHFLGVLGRLAGWEGEVELAEAGFTGRVLRAGESWQLEDAAGATFSFVPLAAGATVSLAGMRWELDRAVVAPLSDLGISNVVEAGRACVACHEGGLACWLFR